MMFSEDQVREMLIKAYEAGWYGCLELKDETADAIIKDLVEKIVRSENNSQTYYTPYESWTIMATL